MSIRIPLSVPNLKGNELKYLTECVRTGWVSTAGRFVTEFEEKTAAYNGIAHGVAMSSGTGALHTALLVIDIGPGHEVLVPTLTFIAPINAIRYTGAEPVFMDSDDHLNIDPEKISEFCERQCTHTKDGRLVNNGTGRTVKAIIPVHIFGNPVNIDPIAETARKFGLAIIEDATESLGSSYIAGAHSGLKTGAVGDIGCYSFNGNKIITSGGGGMLVTDNKNRAERARYLSTQARDDASHYIHNEIGYNYRMTNVEAAVGLAQIESLDIFLAEKKRIYERYCELLRGIDGVRILEAPPYAKANHWLNAIVVDSPRIDRDGMIDALMSQGIEARPLWYPNHLQKPYAGAQTYRIEKAMRWHERVINIPSSSGLTDSEADEVANAIIGAVNA